MQKDMPKIPEKKMVLKWKVFLLPTLNAFSYFLKWEFVPAVFDICVIKDSFLRFLQRQLCNGNKLVNILIRLKENL